MSPFEPKPAALSILMLSTETAPFAKTGGLAEAVPALARALAARGHDVRLVLPRYYFVDRSQLQATGLEMELAFQGRNIPFHAFRCDLPGSRIPVYFIEAEEFFGRDGIYGDSDNPEYADNASRFAFFCRACLALCRALDWIPDIIQAHDWPAGPALAYLALEERQAGFSRTQGVLTIHNIAYQGLFPADEFRALDLDGEQFAPGSFEFFGRLNFLQGAIRHSRAITTVSPGYAGEITTTRFGFGLEGILGERRADLHGILNGLDYDAWDPGADGALAAGFDADRLEGKTQCKLALQTAFGLPRSADTPLIGILSRLVSQKGFVELLAPGCLPRLLEERRLQVVVVGSGQAWCQQAVWKLSHQYPQLAFHQGYTESAARQLLAGSDYLLMPSLIEPCGVSQMAALRYGAIPLVPPQGGLADTVAFGAPGGPVSAAPATGMAIALPVGPESIFRTVSAALACAADDAAGLQDMRRRGMARRFSWADAALAYEKLFRECTGRPD